MSETNQTEWIAFFYESRNGVARNFQEHVFGDTRDSAIKNAEEKESEEIKLIGVSLIPANEWYKLNLSDYRKSF